MHVTDMVSEWVVYVLYILAQVVLTQPSNHREKNQTAKHLQKSEHTYESTNHKCKEHLYEENGFLNFMVDDCISLTQQKQIYSSSSSSHIAV